jgi:hypothetical protein
MIQQGQNCSLQKLKILVIIKGKKIQVLVDSRVPLSYIIPQLVKSLKLIMKSIQEYNITKVGGELVTTVTKKI